MTESTKASKPFPDFPDEKTKGKPKAPEVCNCNAMGVPHRHVANGIEAVSEEEE